MESRRSCDLKFESIFRFHHNWPVYTVLSLVPMGLIKTAKTPCTGGELAIA